jgi:hypothetical protein
VCKEEIIAGGRDRKIREAEEVEEVKEVEEVRRKAEAEGRSQKREVRRNSPVARGAGADAFRLDGMRAAGCRTESPAQAESLPHESQKRSADAIR